MKNNLVAFLSYVPFLLFSSILLHWIAVAYQIQAYPMYENSTPIDHYAAWHQANTLALYYGLAAATVVFLALWKASSTTQKVVFFVPIVVLGAAALTDFWGMFTWWMG
jgi:hypothetical protein